MEDDKIDDSESHFFSLITSLIFYDQIDYWIGNPSVELITGTIFFRKEDDANLKKHLTAKKINFNEIFHELKKREVASNILLVAPIPIDKNFFEFGDFIKQWEKEILELRIIQTSMSRSYGVLICFASSEASQRFYWDIQGKQYNNLEPFLCFLKEVTNIKLVYERAEMIEKEKHDFTTKKKLKKTLKLKREEKEKENEKDPLAIFKFNLNENFDEKSKRSKDKLRKTTEEELFHPCPICFEEMRNLSKLEHPEDTLEVLKHKSRETLETSAILGILCGHFFHWKCLKNWHDEICPLCRYHQQPPETKFCEECGTSEDLWLCLICGFIGCGLENKFESHNVKHFEETKHVYAIEIETKFVYDHSKQSYVHRLLQNAEDGKILEMKDSEKEMQNKIEAIIADFNSVMASQYESQKNYFEEEIKKMVERYSKEENEKKMFLINLQDSKESLTEQLKEQKQIHLQNERNFNEKKIEFENLLKLKYELDSENNALSKKLEKINESNKVTKEGIRNIRTEQIKSLVAQIKDLETHLNIKEKFGSKLQGDDLENSKILITDSKKKKNKKR